jgi:hypothetical protein
MGGQQNFAFWLKRTAREKFAFCRKIETSQTPLVKLDVRSGHCYLSRGELGGFHCVTFDVTGSLLNWRAFLGNPFAESQFGEWKRHY